MKDFKKSIFDEVSGKLELIHQEKKGALDRLATPDLKQV